MKKVTVKEIQDKLLEIALDFDEFCKLNNIEYYLMGGSALGAMRHKGFIPWDDDLDVFMTFDNYQKFLKVGSEILSKEKYYLQKENTNEWPYFFSKVRLNGTTFIEEDTIGYQMHKGLYIDVMCLNNTTENSVYRYLQYISAKFLIAQALANRGYNTDSTIKKIAMNISKILVRGKIKQGLINFVRSLNSKDTKFVGHFFGRAKFNNTSFKKSYLGEQRYVPFEDAFLPVISNVEEYLTVRYGNKYMDMPDKKTKNLYPTHAIFVDFNKSYLEYEKENFDFIMNKNIKE